MTLRLSKLQPLALSAGQIRRELDGNSHPDAVAILKSVSKLPDTRTVVVDIVKYNSVRMQETNSEDIQGQQGSGMDAQSEPSGGAEN